MNALTYLEQLDFDYLFSGYLSYVWIAIGIVIGGFVLHKLFDLKRLIRAATKIILPQQKESATFEDSQSTFNFHHLKKDLDELKAGKNTLIEHLAAAQTVLERIQVDLYELKQIKNSQGDQASKNLKHKTEKEQYQGATSQVSANSAVTLSSLDSASDMTELYNASRGDQSIRARFREKYKPFFINVANDVDRRRNATLPADFRKEVDGSYLAVSQESDEAAVFPNFTLVVVDAVYGPGALGEVFDCGSFDRRFSYPNIRVSMPATFRLTGGQSWKVTQKGRLDLGPGQDD